MPLSGRWRPQTEATRVAGEGVFSRTIPNSGLGGSGACRCPANQFAHIECHDRPPKAALFSSLIALLDPRYMTAICRRNSPVNRFFGIIACTPRTISTTWVTRKLTAMLQAIDPPRSYGD